MGYLGGGIIWIVKMPRRVLNCAVLQLLVTPLSPTVVNGMVYIGATNSNVYAFKLP